MKGILLCFFVVVVVCLFFGFFCLFAVFLFFRGRVSLYSPGCPGTHSVHQAGLKLRNPPASASQGLKLKACATTTRPAFFFFFKFLFQIHFFNVYECWPTCMYVPGANMSYLLVLKLWMVVSHHVDPGNPIGSSARATSDLIR